MELTSLNFFAFVLIGLILTHLSRASVYRATIFAILNILFIASYVDAWWQVAPLAAFLVLGYLAMELVRRRPTAGMLALCVGTVLVAFIVLKRFSFLGDLPTLPFVYLIVGLSYILFRIIHLICEAQEGTPDSRPRPIEYFNYTCNFLTFISGPIQKFGDFRQSFSPAPLEQAAVLAAFTRVATGFFKVLVLSGAANALFLALEPAVLRQPAVAWPVYVALYGATAVAYTIYLYFNFSGYMDIVIGIGRLFGQTLPENFNRPFTAQSFLDFWARWHITLSDWFKLYLFNPLLKALVTRFPDPRWIAWLGVFAFFVTFLVMGIWHGTTVVFVIYGLIMGAGASINKLWQLALTARLGRKGYQRLSARPLYAYACRGITFAYFALGVTCLWVDMEQLTLLASRLGILGWPAACIALTIASAVVMFAIDQAEYAYLAVRARAAAFAQSVVAQNAWLAGQIVTIAIVTSFFHKSPEFVYKAF
jgi:D-alanyl-lipoteichoic acid acyltransferase DltB (MBOAT superfamily)